ncbi:hypothetical protein [Kibdelosporangium aridum]|uniref:hypothetical protein n=1 Tax=Kibdelosporangium aridum TaxID=2030 RepID=UPI0035EF12B1
MNSPSSPASGCSNRRSHQLQRRTDGHLTGQVGHVTTIDIDEDLVNGARDHFAAAGVDNVEAVDADGALGHSEMAPFDRDCRRP